MFKHKPTLIPGPPAPNHSLVRVGMHGSPQLPDGSGHLLVSLVAGQCTERHWELSLCVNGDSGSRLRLPGPGHAAWGAVQAVAAPPPGWVPLSQTCPRIHSVTLLVLLSYLLFWGKSSRRITCTLALFQREERCYLSRSLLLAESGLLAWEGIFKNIFLLIIPCIARCSWNFSIFWERNLLIHQQGLFHPLGPSSLCDWNHVFLSCCNIIFLTLRLISELKNTF